MTETAIAPLWTCTKCGVEKPLSAEFFAPRAGSPTGHRYACRPCNNSNLRRAWQKRFAAAPEKHRARVRAWRAANPEKAREMDRRGRTEERRERDRSNRKKWWASLSPDEKAEQAAKLRDWTAANRERVRKLARDYLDRETPEKRERRLAKIRARRPIYERENPEVIAAKRARRRAREYGAPGSYSRDDVLALLKSQARKCRYCDAGLTKFHVDHFIPLSKGGSNWPTNIVLACATCNASKGDRMPWVWRPDLFSPPE